jgi:general secretion pathway protein H
MTRTSERAGVGCRAALGASRGAPGRGARAGFTIIELLATLVIIVVIVVGVTVAISNIQRADLPAQGGKIAAAVRYLYNLSVINNQSYRLVIDLETGEYWGEELPAESPCDVFLVETEGAKQPNMRSSTKPRKKKDDDEEEEAPRAAFSQVKDNLLTKRTLENKITFTGVITSHHTELQEEGTAEINFFPSGYVEKAYIYLGYGDERITVETRSLLGTAVMHRKKLEPHTLFKKES